MLIYYSFKNLLYEAKNKNIAPPPSPIFLFQSKKKRKFSKCQQAQFLIIAVKVIKRCECLLFVRVCWLTVPLRCPERTSSGGRLALWWLELKTSLYPSASSGNPFSCSPEKKIRWCDKRITATSDEILVRQVTWPNAFPGALWKSPVLHKWSPSHVTVSALQPPLWLIRSTSALRDFETVQVQGRSDGKETAWPPLWLTCVMLLSRWRSWSLMVCSSFFMSFSLSDSTGSWLRRLPKTCFILHTQNHDSFFYGYENPAHNERHNWHELFTQRYLGGRLNKAKAPVHYGFLSVFGVLVLIGQALCCLPQALSVQHKRSMIQNTNVPLLIAEGKAFYLFIYCAANDEKQEGKKRWVIDLAH